jgi:hypothetical protein
MNIGTYGRLVDSHQSDLHRLRGASRPGRLAEAADIERVERVARGRGAVRHVQHLLGTALVEAGLRLLGTRTRTGTGSYPSPSGHRA